MNIADIKNMALGHMGFICIINCPTKGEAEQVIAGLIADGFSDRHNQIIRWDELKEDFCLVPGTGKELSYDSLKALMGDPDLKKLPLFTAKELLAPSLDDILDELDAKILKMEQRML